MGQLAHRLHTRSDPFAFHLKQLMVFHTYIWYDGHTTGLYSRVYRVLFLIELMEAPNIESLESADVGVAVHA